MENKGIKELAEQLRKPSGEKGKEIAGMMNETNIGMTLHSIENLNLSSGNLVMEIGHGNAGHLKYLLELAHQLQYTGYDISELMNSEAKELNQEFIKNHQAEFRLYDGENFPDKDGKFDKIFTVNTIYFWKNPAKMLSEIYRILKPDGIFCITFVEKDFMKLLPFSVFGFTMYNPEDIEELVKNSSFKLEKIIRKTDFVQNKLGEKMNRKFATAVLSKT